MDPFASVGGSPEASKSGASESEVTPTPSTRFGRAPVHGRTTSAGPFHRTKSGRTADTVWEPPGFVREGHELVPSTAITAPAGSTLPGRVTGNRSPHVTSPALQLEPIQPMIFTSSNQATEPPWPLPDPPSPGSEVQFPVIVLGGGDLGGGFGGTHPPGVDWDPVRPCDCPPTELDAKNAPDYCKDNFGQFHPGNCYRQFINCYGHSLARQCCYDETTGVLIDQSYDDTSPASGRLPDGDCFYLGPGLVLHFIDEAFPYSYWGIPGPTPDTEEKHDDDVKQFYITMLSYIMDPETIPGYWQ